MNKIQIAALSKLSNEMAARIDDLEEKISEAIMSLHSMRRDNISFDKYLLTLDKAEKENEKNREMPELWRD